MRSGGEESIRRIGVARTSQVLRQGSNASDAVLFVTASCHSVLLRMPLPVEQDEPSDPIDVSVLGDAVVQPPNDVADLIEQPGLRAYADGPNRRREHAHVAFHQLQPGRHAGYGLAREAAVPTNLLEIFALMQHHGAPTRLLDLTHSAYVACFFAIENAFDESGNCFYDETLRLVLPVEPYKRHLRLTIQQGLFLCPGDVN